MILNTTRLKLVPMNQNDFTLFHKTNTNSFVRKYLWDDEIIPETISIDILKTVEGKFKNEKWGLWKIIDKKSKNYMGYIGFWYFFDENYPQLIYAILPEFTKKGYATEASIKMIDFAFNTLNFKYLTASMDKPNEASVNVCKRLNMNMDKEKEIEGKPTLFFILHNVEKKNYRKAGIKI